MKCRHCDSPLNVACLDLGTAPPSNAYLKAEDLTKDETYYPLRLLVCEECWLVQTEDFAGRESLFTEDYAYFSSYSTSWLNHAKQYVQQMIQRFGLNGNSQVVEVASNDGYLLQYVKQAGIACYGVEPTASTAQASRGKGIETIESFFGKTLAKELAAQGRQADLIAANNVLAHVPDINDFVAGFTTLLKETGVATFEFPHLLELIRHCQFDTVYHEHYSYLSLTAVQRIVASNGLQLFDVEAIPTHGGSLRVFVQRADAMAYPVTDRVGAMLKSEAEDGIKEAGYYQSLQQNAERIRDEVLVWLRQAKQDGKRVAAYGAAAKGNTLLNFAGITPELVPYVVDRNPNKQDKYLPGSQIPIVDEAHLKQDQPDIIWILPWNLKEEIIEQLAYARQWGAQFVTAIPRITVNEKQAA